MGTFGWYLRRLSVMAPTEVIQHLRRHLFRVIDSRRFLVTSSAGEPNRRAYPIPPDKDRIPPAYRQEIVREADELIAGEWVLFRDVFVDVDNPPQWQKDYLSGTDISDERPFRLLNHRNLRDSDIKVVWDLNRWSQLVRIAQAAYVTDGGRYSETVVRWLEDWVAANPPFRGWNWTSALESAVRLIHFAWVESLLNDRIDPALRDAIVVPHVRYTWRHRSFGSSANNHLLGEICGAIVARCRWQNPGSGLPGVETLRSLFEREILLQFEEDGGNKEQAFHYHLFAFELAVHALYSLRSKGLDCQPIVMERLKSAAEFLVNFQTPDKRWDFGDSDDAVLVPFGDRIPTSLYTWSEWVEGSDGQGGPSRWLGLSPITVSKSTEGWHLADRSGYAVFKDDVWCVRVDGSRLGYLSIAAHGHLDAMHVSFWYRSQAVVIDPGTGCYYFDRNIREALAAEVAHNGPVVNGVWLAKRRGVFLWLDHHPRPSICMGEGRDVVVRIDHRGVSRQRWIRPHGGGWAVEDIVRTPKPSEISVTWLFSPGVQVEQVDDSSFRLTCDGLDLRFRVDCDWDQVTLDRESVVSPSFRVLSAGSAIRLVGESNTSRPYVTVLEKQE